MNRSVVAPFKYISVLRITKYVFVINLSVVLIRFNGTVPEIIVQVRKSEHIAGVIISKRFMVTGYEQRLTISGMKPNIEMNLHIMSIENGGKLKNLNHRRGCVDLLFDNLSGSPIFAKTF